MSDIENLINLQEHDVRIRHIEQELRDIPERKKLEEDRLANHKQEVAEAEAILQKKLAKLKEFDLDVEAHKQKIATLRKQQMTLKTNKEFKAMESEILTVEREIGAVEDGELSMMAEVEEVRGQLQARKAELAEEDVVVRRDVAAWDERAAGLQRDLEALQAERKEAAKLIVDEDLFSTYQRVFDRKDRALVPLQDGVCGGCHMKLPPYVFHDVTRETSMVTCDFCGRLLYKQT